MKVALVTGAYKGLGLEWCRQLAQKGYEVILTARDLDKAKHAADSLASQRLRVHPRSLEMSDESQIKELANWVFENFGKIDLIINNAGVNPKDYPDKNRMAKAFYLNDLDAAELLNVIHVNSIAPLLVVKHFRSLLKLSESPLVLNISSWLGSVTNLKFGGHYGYVGSKNLLNVFNKSLSYELKDDGIICVNINPGWVQTDMGGKNASFTPEDAVKNILFNIMPNLSPEQTGSFLNHDGTIHPW